MRTISVNSDERESVPAMDTDSTPESENEPDARSTAPAPPPDTSESAPPSTASLERDVRAATRTGRYALATALGAAIVSSVVSAGSAVYVSGNELARNESVAAAAEVRENRQRIYADLLTGFTDVAGGLGGLKGALMENPPDQEVVRAGTGALIENGSAAMKTVNLVYLVGSEDLTSRLGEFMEPFGSFFQEQLNPFIFRHFGGSNEVTDPGGLFPDGPGLLAEIDGLTVECAEFLDDVVVLAREDIGTG